MPADPSAAALRPEPPAAASLPQPVLLLALVGAASGLAGTFGLGIGIGEAPGPGLFMIPAGVWFGLVVAAAVWKLGRASASGALIALLATSIAWQAAVNLALVIVEPWIKEGPSHPVYAVAGLASGAIGALITWAGAAWAAPALRQPSSALLTVAAGTVLGPLLAATNHLDSPAVLLIPWQAAVAATLAHGLVRPHSPLPVLTGRGSGRGAAR